MENAEVSQEEQDVEQETFSLPDFFQKEFPHLSRFLKDNFVKNIKKTTNRNHGN